MNKINFRSNSQCNRRQTCQRQCTGTTAYARRSPCLLTTARVGKRIQMQHFCHHGDIIRHPHSSYVTTKLYVWNVYRYIIVHVDATIIRSFRKSYFHVSYHRRMQLEIGLILALTTHVCSLKTGF